MDETPNDDLSVYQLDDRNHKFRVKLELLNSPKRMVRIYGNAIGSSSRHFAYYELFVYKDNNWLKVRVPEDMVGDDPFQSIVEVNGSIDSIDNNNDGSIDEAGELGVLAYMDVTGYNGNYTVMLRVVETNTGGQKFIKTAIQEFEVGAKMSILAGESKTVYTPYKRANLRIFDDSVVPNATATIDARSMSNVNIISFPAVDQVGPVVEVRLDGNNIFNTNNKPVLTFNYTYNYRRGSKRSNKFR